METDLAALPVEELGVALVDLCKVWLRLPVADQERPYESVLTAACESQADRSAPWCRWVMEFVARVRPPSRRAVDSIRIRKAAQHGGAASLAGVIARLHQGIDGDEVPVHNEILDACDDLKTLLAPTPHSHRPPAVQSPVDTAVDEAIAWVVLELGQAYAGQLPEAVGRLLMWLLPHMRDRRLLGRVALHLVGWLGGVRQDAAAELSALCALAPELPSRERHALYNTLGVGLLKEIRDPAQFATYLTALTQNETGLQHLALFTAAFAVELSSVEQSPQPMIHVAAHALLSATWRIGDPSRRESAHHDLLKAAARDGWIQEALASGDPELSDAQCQALWKIARLPPLSVGESPTHLARIFFPAADGPMLQLVKRLMDGAVKNKRPDNADTERALALAKGPPARDALITELLHWNAGATVLDEPGSSMQETGTDDASSK